MRFMCFQTPFASFWHFVFYYSLFFLTIHRPFHGRLSPYSWWIFESIVETKYTATEPLLIFIFIWMVNLMFCSPVGGRNHTNANGSSTFRFQVNSCYLCEFCFFGLSVSVFLFLCAFWSVQWVSYCHGDRLVLFIVCRLTGGLYNAAIIFATEIFVWIFMFSAHTHHKMMEIWFSNANYSRREKLNNY